MDGISTLMSENNVSLSDVEKKHPSKNMPDHEMQVTHENIKLTKDTQTLIVAMLG